MTTIQTTLTPARIRRTRAVVAAAAALIAVGITALFSQLAFQNIEVLSLRNKSNRLEELFVSLVEKNLFETEVIHHRIFIHPAIHLQAPFLDLIQE